MWWLRREGWERGEDGGEGGMGERVGGRRRGGEGGRDECGERLICWLFVEVKRKPADAPEPPVVLIRDSLHAQKERRNEESGDCGTRMPSVGF